MLTARVAHCSASLSAGWPRLPATVARSRGGQSGFKREASTHSLCSSPKASNLIR